MQLIFDCEKLKALCFEAAKLVKWGRQAKTLYGHETGPGFWLVGDEGIYLMHNLGAPEDQQRNTVVYARECDPTVLDAGACFDIKRTVYGGDDGADFIEPTIITNILAKGYDVAISLTANMIEISPHPSGPAAELKEPVDHPVETPDP